MGFKMTRYTCFYSRAHNSENRKQVCCVQVDTQPSQQQSHWDSVLILSLSNQTLTGNPNFTYPPWNPGLPFQTVPAQEFPISLRYQHLSTPWHLSSPPATSPHWLRTPASLPSSSVPALLYFTLSWLSYWRDPLRGPLLTPGTACWLLAQPALPAWVLDLPLSSSVTGEVTFRCLHSGLSSTPDSLWPQAFCTRFLSLSGDSFSAFLRAAYVL